MKIVDKGVLEPSFMDFTIPSTFAKNALYYIPQFGHFYCNNEYFIDRKYLDLFLFVYVCSGSLIINTNGQKTEITSNQIALLDCHNPHQYYCTTKVDFLWFHFNGNNSTQYAQLLLEQNGILFTNPYITKLKTIFEQILLSAQAIMVNEHHLSQNISLLFSKLASPPTEKILLNHPLVPAIQYITGHYNEEINLALLAKICNLSISHFIRGFKSYTGATPHEYLLSYRIRQAKQQLLTSSDTIEEITEKCGFNSASHFARAFRQLENISPTQFRKLQF